MPPLAASPDPEVVFTQLADLLVPGICDAAAATVLVGAQLTQWQQHPPSSTADLPAAEFDGNGRGWSVTVYTAGYPVSSSATALPTEPDYVAVLTCGGSGEPPTVGEVALIELAGHYAVDTVRHAQQSALLEAGQRQIANLQIAVGTNRGIGAAVGVLMARHQVPYRQAFELLVRSSQDSNRKLAAVADTVLYTGTLPPADHRPPRRHRQQHPHPTA